MEKELLLSILYSNTLKVVMMALRDPFYGVFGYVPSAGDKMELEILEPRKIGCHEPLLFFVWMLHGSTKVVVRAGLP